MLCFHFWKELENCYDIKIAKSSGSILHGASKEPEAYLEPSQKIVRECFCKVIFATSH